VTWLNLAVLKHLQYYFAIYFYIFSCYLRTRKFGRNYFLRITCYFQHVSICSLCSRSCYVIVIMTSAAHPSS